MAKSGDSSDFNATRAELFEAISHPVRIKILQALSERPMGFSELGRAVGIESGGHLGFHLTKLEHLVKTTPEGTYALTGDGKEALWSINSLRKSSNGASSKPGEATVGHRNWAKPIIAGLLIAIVALGGVAAFQQQQIMLLENSLAHSNDSTSNSLVFGSLSKASWAPTTSYPGTFGEGCITVLDYVYCTKGIDSGATYAPLSSSGVGAWTSTNGFSQNGIPSCVGSSGYMYCVTNGTVLFAPVSSSGVGTWTATTSYPVEVDGAEGGQACVSSSGYIYCVGGSTGQSTQIETTDATFYAPLSSSGVGSWTRTTSYPMPIAGHSCLAFSGYIYCVGGQTGNENGTLTDVTYFAKLSSSGIGSWSQSTSYPLTILWHSCLSYSSFIYCVGGHHSPNGNNATYYASLSTSGIGPWSKATDYPIPIDSLTCMADGGYVYCMGGFKTHSVYYTALPSAAIGNNTSTR